MNRCTSFSPPKSRFFQLSILIAIAALSALDAASQKRDDAGRYEKAALKSARPCTVGAAGEVTALVKNGVELSVNEDFDCDGIADAYDNCVGIPNRDQADSDGNGIGNACESATTIRAKATSTNRPPETKTRGRKVKEPTKNRSDKKTKDRKARAADRRSRAGTKTRRHR